MKKALVTLLAVTAFVMLAPAASGHAVKNAACWNCMFANGDPDDGFLDPYTDPIAGGVAGGVRGGDGFSCSYAEVLAGCTPDDLALNPCMGYECDGDEGTGEVCYNDFWLICWRHPSSAGGSNQTFVTDNTPIPDLPVDYTQCPGADDPAYDPNDSRCW